jgi:hypothetical protein
MALVRDFIEKSKERQSVHEDVECAYSIVQRDGKRYLQLETFGSKTRKIPGKTSQSIQFDETALRKLRRIIDEVLGQS